MGEQCAGHGNRPAHAPLAGRRAAGAGRPLSADRLQRLLPPGRVSRPSSTSSRSRPSRWFRPRIEAYRATDDSYWLDQARLAFEWFPGRNDLGLPVYDASSGGCCDGLHADRVNQNQGAESTLAFLLALAEMQLLES